MVQVLLVLLIVFGLCVGSRAETLPPLADATEQGVLLMVVTGQVDQIGKGKAVITSDVYTRDRYSIVYVVYSKDRKNWLRSAVKAVKQYNHLPVKIKIDGLTPGVLYYYESVASGENGISMGNVHVFLAR